MSATETPASTDGPETAADRRSLIAIIGAVVVVLAVTVGIVVFGFVPLPDYPHLADDPDPSIPGTIAYVHVSGEDHCVLVRPASGGAATEVACVRDGGFDQRLAWTVDGKVAALHYGPDGAEIIVYDPQRGEVERIGAHRQGSAPERRPHMIFSRQDDRTVRGDGTALRVESSMEGRATVRAVPPGGSSRDLLVVEGPRDYAFTDAQWSPDGAWILLADSRGRLIVVGEDGQDPAILDDNGQRRGWWATSAAWYIPGEETYTVDLDDHRN